MEVRVPHHIIYKVEKPVLVSDFVVSLLATEQLIRDCGPILEALFPGLVVEKIEVAVGEIAEGSLSELIFATLFLSFQKTLESDVPAAIESLTGASIPAGYDSIVSLAFCLILFYGVDAIYTQVNKGVFSRKLRRQLNDVTKEISRETGLSEEKIFSIFEDKFGKSRLRLVMQMAVDFFAISKRSDNAPIIIQNRFLDRGFVSEVPSSAQIEEAEISQLVQQFENVTVEIHAQDIDRAKTGWAAVVPNVSPKRMKMELYPPIQPQDLYTRSKIKGDVAVVFDKRRDGSYQPTTIHLMSIRK